MRNALHPQRLRRDRSRKNLERQLGHHAEASQAADQKFRNVETGGVLDDFATRVDHASVTADELNTEQEIADAAVAKASGSRQAGGDRPADRRAGIRQHRIERQVLTSLRKRRCDFRSPVFRRVR